MRRYKFLPKDFVFNALDRLRSAFLAARDGGEVEEIIKGLLTYDEKMKLGRRIEIANMLSSGLTHDEIIDQLKVGRDTVTKVNRKLNNYPLCFKLINVRDEKVESEFKRKAYKKEGSYKMIYKKKVYTGFKRKNVKR